MLLTVKDYGPGAGKTIPKPPGYDPKNYAPEPTKDTWWARGPLPNQKYQFNENLDGSDATQINWDWVTGSRTERRKIWESIAITPWVTSVSARPSWVRTA